MKVCYQENGPALAHFSTCSIPQKEPCQTGKVQHAVDFLPSMLIIFFPVSYAAADLQGVSAGEPTAKQLCLY